MMMRLKVPDPVLINEARRWVLAGGTLAQIPQKDLSYDIVRQAFADLKVVNGSFSVEWTAQLNAPQSGDYTFFVSPIDVNMGFQQIPIKFSMTVFLAGQAIISAAPPATDPSASIYQLGPPPQSNWTSKSNAVSLTAGKPVALRVIATVDAPLTLPPDVLHAMLFWQGPGVAKSIVPASAFTQPDTGNPGLKTNYTWSVNGKQQTLTRVDPAIDIAWTNSPFLLAADTTIASQAADTMWQTMTLPDFVTSQKASGPTVKLHPFLREPGDVSSGLSTNRRGAFLDLVLQNPPLLDPMDAKQAVRFFWAFRVGTPDKALDVFGAWAARRADLPCEISTDRGFDRDTRIFLSSMGIFVTQQLPSQATRLQNEFLQLPDGRCSLPVAYTLAYSYVGREKLADWIALLEAKLSDPSVTGDLRVNWLLARAQTQELNRPSPGHYPFRAEAPPHWPFEGRVYLDLALEAAQSPANKVRVAREIAGRLVWNGEFQTAKALLQQLLGSLPDDQKAVVVALQQQIDRLAASPQVSPAGQASASTKAYVDTLKARRAQAASAGNSDAVSRYDALINAAQSKTP
jgi:hypothetical protein